jgi:Restriction endonuclease
MHASTGDPQARGRALEGFINKLFRLFDLEPRAAYSLEHEQIDGAFSFETDDYVLEAKWWKDPMEREQLDVFATKVRRKGRNALGLYVSINGFTKGALDVYSDSTPFVTMDGGDIMAVLDERIRLDEMLRRKKRHMNETGSCYFPASEML